MADTHGPSPRSYCRRSRSQTSWSVAARVWMRSCRSMIEMPTWSKPGMEVRAVRTIASRASSRLCLRSMVRAARARADARSGRPSMTTLLNGRYTSPGSADVGSVDQFLGDVAQLDVAVRGRPDEEGEGAVLVHLVPLHDDADRLSDQLPGRQRLMQVGELAGLVQRDGRVRGERGGEILHDRVDAVTGRGVEVEPTERALLVQEQPDRHLRPEP